MTPEEIIKQICEKHGLTVLEVKSSRREKRLMPCRVEITHRLRKSGMSFPQIGKIMNRDHTSIIHQSRWVPKPHGNVKG